MTLERQIKPAERVDTEPGVCLDIILNPSSIQLRHPEDPDIKFQASGNVGNEIFQGERAVGRQQIRILRREGGL
ncbi:hypothetical protein CEXT_728071 [Caerostris extrusa]|uniref:Uncharacterized protein n=1 Tax=Caerostris extrusa TaxID=172846 RepID=A0AAV4Q9Z6_CAEEX|nr:hypothetical protein CEXT_728071 [Caerostris extrusa]